MSGSLQKKLTERFPEITDDLISIFRTCESCNSHEDILDKFRTGDGLNLVNRVINEITQNSSSHGKNNQKANDSRRKGNQFYEAKDFHQAHSNYTQSIMSSVQPAQSGKRIFYNHI